MPPDYGPLSDYQKRRQHLKAQTARCVSVAEGLFGEPRSVLDVGCGGGAHISALRERGIDAFGVDLAAPEEDGFMRQDLKEPLTLGRRFEWVLCWEVAEHLPPDCAETLCDSLARHMLQPDGRLLFTAAPPGQRGPGHINCQPAGYWRLLLQDRGLHWQRDESLLIGELWSREAPKAPWYGRNIQCYAWA